MRYPSTVPAYRSFPSDSNLKRIEAEIVTKTFPDQIPVVIKSGKNHGRVGIAKAYSSKHGGFLVEFFTVHQIHDSEVWEVDGKQPKKRYYSINHLEATAENRFKLLMLCPNSPNKERRIAEMVAQKLKSTKQDHHVLDEINSVTMQQISNGNSVPGNFFTNSPLLTKLRQGGR